MFDLFMVSVGFFIFFKMFLENLSMFFWCQYFTFFRHIRVTLNLSFYCFSNCRLGLCSNLFGLRVNHDISFLHLTCMTQSHAIMIELLNELFILLSFSSSSIHNFSFLVFRGSRWWFYVVIIWQIIILLIIVYAFRFETTVLT